MTAQSLNVRERFDTRWTPEPNSGCWLWAASIGSHGYGDMRVDGKARLAHRLSYESYVGSIPEGYQIDHLCRNRACVNPRHLEAVTPAENQHRMIAHRKAVGGFTREVLTVCKRGHDLTPDNVYVAESGTRTCRECYRKHWRDWNARCRAATA